MATLSTLKLSAAIKPTHLPAVQLRRNKLAKRLWEQTELAKAEQEGRVFSPTKFKSLIDKETGARRNIETSKRIKPWWFTTESGKTAVGVRYGSRLLELAKGKYAVELNSRNDLVATLDTIKNAVLSGELDVQIESAANKLRDGFDK